MPHHHPTGASWTERTKPSGAAETDLPVEGLPLAHKQSFKQPHTSLGVAGHIVHMAGVFVPLVAGELVQDAAKYKKTVRVASIATALAYEVLYTVKEEQHRKEQAAKLADCRGRK